MFVMFMLLSVLIHLFLHLFFLFGISLFGLLCLSSSSFFLNSLLLSLLIEFFNLTLPMSQFLLQFRSFFFFSQTIFLDFVYLFLSCLHLLLEFG